ncbi:MAG: tRNA modification GTPase [Thalassolituus oleivorans]
MGGSTIAAIATARGEAALSIVRLSGPDALRIAASVFDGAAGELAGVASHTAWFGQVKDLEGRAVDQVVVTVFRGPRSSTGETVVEFTCHGGHAAPQAVLTCLYAAGAVPAEPGEFTRRAFLNGKLDLEQAEAVMDLIHSRSEASHRVSVRQLQGRLKSRLALLRAGLLELCGLVELELDFGEEDVEFADRSQVAVQLATLSTTLDEMLLSSRYSDRWREGISVVIAGKPNAGKSTLLNALVGTDRVIVSSTPGTTRDFVECEMVLDGLLLRLTDTAGIRVSEDEIEAEGVRRTEALIATADVLLYVFDSLERLSDGEVSHLRRVIGSNEAMVVVLVANKADLLTAGLEGKSCSYKSLVVGGEGKGILRTPSEVTVSAQRAIGNPEEVEALLEIIRTSLPPSLLDFDASDGMINERHQHHLREAEGAVRAAQALLASGSGGEFLSLELRAAMDALGSITGEITNEDILSEIFGRFCIGK